MHRGHCHIICIITVVWIVVACGCIQQENEPQRTGQGQNKPETPVKQQAEYELPEIFVLHLSEDATSSGGTRYSEFYASFDRDGVTLANRSYYGSGTSGDNFCVEEYNTTAKRWGKPLWTGRNAGYINETGIEPWPCNDMEYLTRENVTEAIKNGKILPKDRCRHFGACYEIQAGNKSSYN
jgi:hypothetical protein